MVTQHGHACDQKDSTVAKSFLFMIRFESV